MPRSFPVPAACAALLLGVTGVPSADAAPAFGLRQVMSGLSQPVQLTAPRGDGRLFVVEQGGRILVQAGGRRRVFLDLRSQVRLGAEQGLLSMAFHPGFRRNGRFFVDYTDRAGDTRVVEYRARGDRAVPGSARPVWFLDDPYPNHNGGLLQFGPDGLLHLGMGDGGAGGDPQNRAQNPRSPFGKLLRFDVNGPRPYRVPATNPFARDRRGLPLVWALGLRNPWRYSFDRVTGDLWVGDVGQNAYEEISVLPRRFRGVANFGWDAFEGRHRFEAKRTLGRLVGPLVEIGHREGACSVTGGYVYRGRDVPALRGHYLYADFCADWIRTLRLAGGRAVDRGQRRAPRQISSFGEDGRGELYVVSLLGTVHRVVAA